MRFLSSLTWRWSARLVVLALLLAGIPGCRRPVADHPGKSLDQIVNEQRPPAEQLREQIDAALEFSIQKRRLNVKDQAAWQVVHGILAFGREFPVREGDADVPALDYLRAGKPLKGWQLSTGEALNTDKTRFGVRTAVERGSLTGQGHYDQWLGYLANCRLPLETTLMVEGQERTLADYLEQVERDVHLNIEHEFSWTLMAVSTYRPAGYTWQAADGSAWSIERLVEYELEHDILASPCGGMHRLSGLAMARNAHAQAGGEQTAVWERCQQRLRDSVAKIQEYQNADGSLSANFLARGGANADVKEALHANGHTLEFVILASNDEELKQEWIERSVRKLCELFRKTKPIDLECGALYHAAHGLAVYRERMYGPRSYLTAE